MQLLKQQKHHRSMISADGVLFEFEQPSSTSSSAGEAAAAAGRWKERGRGELRLNVASAEKESKTSSSARLVMRSRGLHRLLLNANLWAGMKAARMDGGRGATFAVVNAAAVAPAEGGAAGGASADGGAKDAASAAASAAASSSAASAAKLATYAFRCSSTAKLDEFLAAVEEHNKRAAASAEGEGK